MVEAKAPKIKEIASPPKTGSVIITAEPRMMASAVRRIGRRRTAPASITASSSERPSARRTMMKSMRRSELRTTMPASAITPIIDVAVKGCCAAQCPGKTPIRVSGIAPITTTGMKKER